MKCESIDFISGTEHNPPMRPIPVNEISNYLPHRPPMVWIDEVLHYAEKEGECRVILKEGEHYLGAQGLRPSSCLEFIAQAYGFISACYHIYVLDPNARPLNKAFFASIKNGNLPRPQDVANLRAGNELRIRIQGVRQLGQIVTLTGQVIHESTVLAEAQIRIFREIQN